jgi:hypothetical protein
MSGCRNLRVEVKAASWIYDSEYSSASGGYRIHVDRREWITVVFTGELNNNHLVAPLVTFHMIHGKVSHLRAFAKTYKA